MQGWEQPSKFGSDFLAKNAECPFNVSLSLEEAHGHNPPPPSQTSQFRLDFNWALSRSYKICVYLEPRTSHPKMDPNTQ